MHRFKTIQNFISKIFENLFGDTENYSLENRIFNFVCLFSSIVGIMGLIFNLLFPVTELLTYAAIFNMILYWFFYYYSRHRKKFKVLVLPYIFITAFLLSLIFIINGGIDGPVSFFYFLLMFLGVNLVKLRHRKYVFILLSLNLILLIAFQYNFEDKFIMYPDRISRFSDIGYTLVYALGMYYYGVFVIKKSFDLEREKVVSQNLELNQKNEEISQKNIIIEEEQEKIKESISYAKHIQDAILPSKSILTNNFKDSFLLFKPRDIVSGYIYWFEKVLVEYNEIIIVAVIDCTGHGVPGALMSIMSYSLLNEVVIGENIYTPGQILNQLEAKLNLTLLNKGEGKININDGMDIALLVIDKASNIVRFAGANRPLYQVREKELIVYKGNNFSIGGASRSRDKKFEEIEIKIQENDIYYLFSDGYSDQFGGKNGKKFMQKNFKKLINEISELDMTKQRGILNTEIIAWKNQFEQTDDILVIGVKV